MSTMPVPSTLSIVSVDKSEDVDKADKVGRPDKVDNVDKVDMANICSNTRLNNLVPCTVNVMSAEELDMAALEMFGEKEEEVGVVVRRLREWVDSQPHLVSVKRDEEFLRMFHRGCGGGSEEADLKKTKQKLDLFFTARSLLPAWFSDWDIRVPAVQNILKAGVVLPLKGYDRKGRYVILVRHSKIDPQTMLTEDLYKTLLLLFTMAMEGNRQAYTHGYALIADHEGVTAGHVLMMTPGIMKRHTVIFQDSYPMESEVLIDSSSLLLLNMPSLMEKLFNMFLTYLDEKYKSMIRLVKVDRTASKPYSHLEEELGADILPLEYGGTNESVEDFTQFWLEEASRQKNWLEDQSELLKVNEELRPGKSKTSSDIFGSSCSIM